MESANQVIEFTTLDATGRNHFILNFPGEALLLGYPLFDLQDSTFRVYYQKDQAIKTLLVLRIVHDSTCERSSTNQYCVISEKGQELSEVVGIYSPSLGQQLEDITFINNCRIK